MAMKSARPEPMRLAAAILAGLGLAAPAASAGTLDSLLGPGSLTCVLMVAIEKAGASVAPLSADQFNFARGAFVAAPPMSPTLPPGERAALVEADGGAFVALITGEGRAAETCARFNAPPSFLGMLSKIAAGVTPKAGRSL